jgi:hypothetical protein
MDVIICTSVDGTFLEKFAFKGTISTFCDEIKEIL